MQLRWVRSWLLLIISLLLCILFSDLSCIQLLLKIYCWVKVYGNEICQGYGEHHMVLIAHLVFSFKVLTWSIFQKTVSSSSSVKDGVFVSILMCKLIDIMQNWIEKLHFSDFEKVLCQKSYAFSVPLRLLHLLSKDLT